MKTFMVLILICAPFLSFSQSHTRIFKCFKMHILDKETGEAFNTGPNPDEVIILSVTKDSLSFTSPGNDPYSLKLDRIDSNDTSTTFFGTGGVLRVKTARFTITSSDHRVKLVLDGRAEITGDYVEETK